MKIKLLPKSPLTLLFAVLGSVFFSWCLFNIGAPSNAQALILEATWQDKLHIKIDKMELQPGDCGSDDKEWCEQNFDRAKRLLAEQSQGQVYSLIDNDLLSFALEWAGAGCGGDNNRNRLKGNADGEARVTTIDYLGAYVTSTDGCKSIMGRETFDDGDTITLKEDNRKHIWFVWTGADSMKRIDSSSDAFTKSPENDKIYWVEAKKEEGCVPKVTIKGDPGDLVSADFDTCEGVDIVHDILISGDPNNANAPPPGTAQNENPTCESSGGLTWVICPLVNGLAELADGAFDNFIAPMLRTPPVDIANTNEPIFKVWVAMRNIANILLIVAMIVVVFGQAIGGGLVDAYTAKKVLPRILAAAIMINLSIYMVALAVDMTNVVGQGLSRLLYAPFESVGQFKLELSNPTAGLGIGALLIGGGAAIWAGGALVPYILLFVLLPLALAMLGVVFTLVLRMGLIQFLIVSAPIACVLYCLPNTEKYFKKWWDLFLKTLMVYPIIVLIFAIADILAVTTNIAGRNDEGAAQLPAEIIGIVLMVLPLFMIPYAFKLAGGAITAVHSAILDRGKKGVEAIKGNPNDANSMQNKVRRRAGENITMKQARLVDPGRDVGATRRQKLIGGFADKFGNVDSRLAMYNMKSREEAEQMSATGRDALRYAAGGYEEGGKYYNSKGKEISKNTYKRGKQLYGSTPTGIAQNLEYALRKAQTDDDFAAFRHAYARNAQQNGWNQKEMNDAWAAATYPHKSSLAASEWYSSPKLESDGSISFKDITNDVVSTVDPVTGETKKSSYSSYVGDLTNTRLGYQLPARDQDYRAMLDRQTQLETKIETHRKSGAAGNALTEEEATQLAHTYQVFDLASHQYAVGTPGGTGAAAAGTTISATAGTATAQPIIEQAQRQRQAAGLRLGDATGGQRAIEYDGVGGGGGGVAGTVQVATVSGDEQRSAIPRNVAAP